MDYHTVVWSHEITLPGQRTSASKAREFVRHHLREHGLSDLADDVQLVASELATNAVVHARTPFTLTLQVMTRQVLLLKVKDRAPSAPVLVVAPVLHRGHAASGMALVERISRDWGVTGHADGSKSVWASFDVPPMSTHDSWTARARSQTRPQLIGTDQTPSGAPLRQQQRFGHTRRVR